MRRMVKENLLKFDGTPLFPERIAYTVPYKLSDAEAQLYKAVTDYVREEFNRAEALENDKRAGTVGFALTILQRRLASSPEAIYQSLRRRRERLEKRLRELELLPAWVCEDDVTLTAASCTPRTSCFLWSPMCGITAPERPVPIPTPSSARRIGIGRVGDDL